VAKKAPAQGVGKFEFGKIAAEERAGGRTRFREEPSSPIPEAISNLGARKLKFVGAGTKLFFAKR